MRILVLIFVTMYISFTASAQSPEGSTEKWTVKSAACASGELDPNRTFEVHALFPALQIRAVDPDQGAVVETKSDAVLVVKASGDNTGACKNNNIPTVLTVTFSK
jgi:hypothetical protein